MRAHLTRKAKAQASLENVRDSFQNDPSKPMLEEQVTPQPPIGEKQTKDGYQIADVLYLRCRYKFSFFLVNKMALAHTYSCAPRAR